MDPVLTRHNRNDLFTHDECAKILGNVLGSTRKGKLLKFSTVAELGTIGYLGEYFHLHLTYSLEDSTNDETVHETRLFVKSMPYQNADMSFFIEKSGILKKEATLYKTLLNELRKLSKTVWCAQCYLARKDLFVMENITDLGYEPLKDSTGFLNKFQMKPLLKGLATMHACSIAYEVQNNLLIGEALKDTLYEVTVSPTVDWYIAGVRAVLSVALEHPAYQKVPVQTFIRNQLPAILNTVYDMVNPSKKYRNVFCHRDTWGGNVFFSKLDPHHVASVFVDFQLCRYSPPAIDVLMAIFLNIKPKDRKSIDEECYQHYYDCLRDELKRMGIDVNDHITIADYRDSIRQFRLFGSLYNCIAATVIRVPGDYLKSMKENDPEKFHSYCNIDRTKEVIELVRNDRDFREYMFDCIDDLLQLVLP